VQISATNSWVQVTASDRNSYAIDTSGKLWAWGNNAYGQLGDNTVVTKSSPIQVGTATDWTGVYTGAWSLHAHAIKNDNTLWGWG
jgi:alpha-tubulin suppressor-like RCC1 family protein